MLEANGVPWGTYRLVSVGSTRQRLDALVSGQVAGCLLSPPHDMQALDAGFRHLDEAASYFDNYPGLTVAATRRWASEHRSVVVSYARALIRGTVWAADDAHRQAMIDYLVAWHGIGLDEAQRRYAAATSGVTKVLPSLDEVVDSLQVARNLRKEFTGRGGELDSHFDPALMEEAARRTGAAAEASDAVRT